MSLRIRHAQPADLDQLVTLWKELADFHATLDPRFALTPDTEERWRDSASHPLEDDNWCILLAKDHGKVDGFISGVVRNTPDVFLEVQHCHITNLIVTAPLRLRGIGEQLCRAPVRWFHEHGITVIELDKRMGNGLTWPLGGNENGVLDLVKHSEVDLVKFAMSPIWGVKLKAGDEARLCNCPLG